MSETLGIRREDVRALSLTLLMLAGVLLVTLPRFVYVGDAVAMRVGTIQLIEHGGFEVPADYAETFGERGQYFYHNEATGSWYSKYGALNSLFYVPPLLAHRVVSGELLPLDALSPSERLTRSLVLSLFNILVSLVFAIYLYVAGRRYAESPSQASLFVLMACLGTFAWNYLRAHTVEIFQVTLFTALFVHLICGEDLRSKHQPTARKHDFLAAIIAGLLILAKPLFVLLIPLLGVLWLDRLKNGSWRESMRLVCPIAVSVGLLALINWKFFGVAWKTGYEQWEATGRIFAADIRPALYGFSLSARKSVFLYFPLFGIALLGYRSFLKSYSFDGRVVLASLGVFLIGISIFSNWTGDWCFGPRYLLFLLPCASLPIVRLWRNEAGFLRWTWIPALAFSIWLGIQQLWVHSLEPFAAFHAKAIIVSRTASPAADYFDQPMWVINRDLLRMRFRQREFPPLEAESLSPELKTRIQAELSPLASPNSYWLARLAYRSKSEN